MEAQQPKVTLIVIAHFEPVGELNGSKIRLLSAARYLAEAGLRIIYVRTGTRDVYEFDAAETAFKPTIEKWVAYRRARPSMNIRAVMFMWAWISRSKSSILKAMGLNSPQRLIILDTNDFLAERTLREQKSTFFQYPPSANLQNVSLSLEQSEFNSCDVILGITAEEVEAIRALTDNPVLELGYVDPIKSAPVEFSELNPEGGYTTGYLGSQNTANLTTLYRSAVIAYQSGRVKTFYAAGYICRYKEELSWIQKLFPPGWFHILGGVDDVAEFYEKVDFVSSIFSFGSGLKIKVIEALNNGTRIITNEIGAEGVSLSEDYGIYLADSVVEYSDAISRMSAPEAKRPLESDSLFRLKFQENAKLIAQLIQ